MSGWALSSANATVGAESYQHGRGCGAGAPRRPRIARDLDSTGMGADSGGLPGQAGGDCSERDPNRCELFLVERESAGGTAEAGALPPPSSRFCLEGKILKR